MFLRWNAVPCGSDDGGLFPFVENGKLVYRLTRIRKVALNFLTFHARLATDTQLPGFVDRQRESGVLVDEFELDPWNKESNRSRLGRPSAMTWITVRDGDAAVLGQSIGLQICTPTMHAVRFWGVR